MLVLVRVIVIEAVWDQLQIMMVFYDYDYDYDYEHEHEHEKIAINSSAKAIKKKPAGWRAFSL